MTNILKFLFPVPKSSSKRVITFANKDDYISFRFFPLSVFSPHQRSHIILFLFLSFSFSHHMYKKEKGGKEIELKEVGPRFELRLYQVFFSLSCSFLLYYSQPFQIQLGTIDIKHAAVEWTLRPYMNTSKKRQFLAGEN